MKKSILSVLMALGFAMFATATATATANAAPGKPVPLGCGVLPLSRIALSQGYLTAPELVGKNVEAYPALVEFEALFKVISITTGAPGIRNVTSFDGKVASILRDLGRNITYWKQITDEVRRDYIDSLGRGQYVEQKRLALNDWTNVLEGYRDAHDRIVAEALRVRPCFPS